MRWLISIVSSGEDTKRMNECVVAVALRAACVGSSFVSNMGLLPYTTYVKDGINNNAELYCFRTTCYEIITAMFD
ncbi:MAG: hypothetical protein GY820_04900 [Gammaproteobacteria bacterium]|nr:hypothetical protein [Gammaproteobacteria bacterium]